MGDDAFMMKQVPYLQCPDLGTLIRGLPMFTVDGGRACRIAALRTVDDIDVRLEDGNHATLRSQALSRTSVATSETKARSDTVSTVARTDSSGSLSTRGS